MTNTKFLTLPEAAAIARAPVNTLRHWIRNKRLPATKPGKRVLVEHDVLVAFLRQESNDNNADPSTEKKGQS